MLEGKFIISAFFFLFLSTIPLCLLDVIEIWNGCTHWMAILISPSGLLEPVSFFPTLQERKRKKKCRRRALFTFIMRYFYMLWIIQFDAAWDAKNISSKLCSTNLLWVFTTFHFYFAITMKYSQVLHHWISLFSEKWKETIFFLLHRLVLGLGLRFGFAMDAWQFFVSIWFDFILYLYYSLVRYSAYIKLLTASENTMA